MRLATIACVAVMLTASAAAQTIGGPGHIYVVRHAEKVSETADALSATGSARAACLAATLKDAPVKAVITSQFQRTQQTATPTAEGHGVKAKAMPGEQFQAIAEEAKREARSGDVLIVGHSNTVPQIVKALTGRDVTVGSTQYDQMFVIREGSLVELHYCPAQAPGPESKMK